MSDDSTNKETTKNFQIGHIGDSWTGVELLSWLKFEDRIRPTITKLLPYDTSPLMPNYDGLETFGELLFLYTNKDLWEF